MTRVLVLGGARSGKSEFAESLLAGVRDGVYVATAFSSPDDIEWERRIAAHRVRRPSGWTTIETHDPAAVLGADGPAVLLDSVTTWLSWVIEATDLTQRVDAFVAAWTSTARSVVAVSDEVGSGVVPDSPLGRLFRDELGSLNRRLAAAADEVHLVVAGLALRLR